MSPQKEKEKVGKKHHRIVFFFVLSKPLKQKNSLVNFPKLPQSENNKTESSERFIRANMFVLRVKTFLSEWEAQSMYVWFLFKHCKKNFLLLFWGNPREHATNQNNKCFIAGVDLFQCITFERIIFLMFEDKNKCEAFVYFGHFEAG